MVHANFVSDSASSCQSKAMSASQVKNMVESIRVRVPSKSRPPSPTSSPSSPCRCHGGAECCSSRFLLQNHANFDRSGPPSRLMYFGPNGSWLDFSSEVIGSLRSAFLEKKPVVDLSVAGSRYLFDFLRMLQIDLHSGNQRSIAWIDEKDDFFFPKVFVGEEFPDNLEEEREKLKIEIEIRIDGVSLKRKREKEEEGEEAEVSSDDVWKRQRLSFPFEGTKSTSSKWPNARALKEDEKAYLLVREQFLLGMRKIDPNVTITAIHQCTRVGPLEKARLEVFEKQMEITKAARGGASNTVYAWHGASGKCVESVLAHGFGVPTKFSEPECFGVGLYLSPVGLPHVSAKMSELDDNGEKHVILCRVILGNVEKVEAGSQQCYPSSVDFDTGADDPKNPNLYIVWTSNMNRHVFPECVVSFKPSNPVQGQVRGSTRMKYSIEKLFTKMKSFLPSAKIREVATLYGTYRAGKLARDVFIRQLRRTVGDKVLLSTIQEIRGVV